MVSSDKFEVVREMALRRLDRRAYSQAELKAVLLRRGADEEVVDQVLQRLAGVGLLDDKAYASDLVEQGQGLRHLSRRAVVLDLQRRGLSPEVIDEVTIELDDQADLAAARQVAASKKGSLINLEPAVAWRRLTSALARKGYGPAVVYQVANETLRETDNYLNFDQ